MLQYKEMLQLFLKSDIAAGEDIDSTDMAVMNLENGDSEFRFVSDHTQKLFDAYQEGAVMGFTEGVRHERRNEFTNDEDKQS